LLFIVIGRGDLSAEKGFSAERSRCLENAFRSPEITFDSLVPNYRNPPPMFARFYRRLSYSTMALKRSRKQEEPRLETLPRFRMSGKDRKDDGGFLV
jgi:hypothetical protein